ncbi:MAG: hypothetical protein ABFC80_09545 [Coriobacteriales bacterium]
MRVAVCDPGIADTGVIAYDTASRAIVDAATFRTSASGPRPGFEATLARASGQVDRVLEFMRDNGCEMLVAEGYEDIQGPQRGAKHRWTTPLMLGILSERCGSVVWQSPVMVMTSYRDHKAAWKAGFHNIVEGDEMLTNDHLRSCGCHLLAWESSR